MGLHQRSKLWSWTPRWKTAEWRKTGSCQWTHEVLSLSIWAKSSQSENYKEDWNDPRLTEHDFMLHLSDPVGQTVRRWLGNQRLSVQFFWSWVSFEGRCPKETVKTSERQAASIWFSRSGCMKMVREPGVACSILVKLFWGPLPKVKKVPVLRGPGDAVW